MFELSLSELISFLLGGLFGVLLFSFIYVYFLVRGMRVETKKPKQAAQDIDETYLAQMIKDAQDQFKDTYQKEHFSKEVFSVSMELVEKISAYYYPASKYPLLELSVDEMLALTDYINQRLDSILNQKILKNTRHIRVSKFVEAYEFKQRIEQQKFVKAARSKAFRNTTKIAFGVMNAFNPVYWFRRLVITTSVDFMTHKIARTMIAIVGEETAKVYSKKLFNQAPEFDLVERELLALDKEIANHEET